MPQSEKAVMIIAAMSKEKPSFGDLKKRAKEIKSDHVLALELWQSGDYYPRLFATLIFDKKQLTSGALDRLSEDMLSHPAEERNLLTDWLLANQLMKDKKLVALMKTWEAHPSPVMRRLFWYHQARLRWMGTAQPENSRQLLDSLEHNLKGAEPSVQWAMNFCAGQIGVHEPEFRSRCIQLGLDVGLYKDDPVSRNCTPSYLPEFIRIEVAKRS